MNPQLRRASFASTAFIIGFFVLGRRCAGFSMSATSCCRSQARSSSRWCERMPALWPHTLQTLYTTLVGFAFGIVIGIVLGRHGRLLAARL